VLQPVVGKFCVRVVTCYIVQQAHFKYFHTCGICITFFKERNKERETCRSFALDNSSSPYKPLRRITVTLKRGASTGFAFIRYCMLFCQVQYTQKVTDRTYMLCALYGKQMSPGGC
jgi:hypothetical protein